MRKLFIGAALAVVILSLPSGLRAHNTTRLPAVTNVSVAEVPGYGAVKFVSGVPVKDYSNLLPAAPDSNYFLSSPFVPVAQLGDGYALRYGPQLGPFFSRIGGAATLSAVYDTGFVDGAFSPSNVALPGTPEARRSGNLNMTTFDDAAAGKLIWDVQVDQDSANGVQTQAFLELRYTDGAARVENLYGRLIGDDQWLTAGLAQSYTSHIAALPTSILGDVVPVGAINKQVAGISFTQAISSNWNAGFAIENPDTDFIPVNATDVQLTRYPTLAARMRYVSDNNFDQFQVASFVRWFGSEDVATHEDWVAGWGVSAVARKMVLRNRTALYLGFTGGNGVGNYLFGVESGAGPGAASLTALSASGAYGGIAHLWFQDRRGRQLWSNLVGGYSQQGAAAAIPGTSIRRGRQAFTNLIYNVNDKTAFGLEYHYLDRTVRSGLGGDNHRIQFVLIIGTSHVKDATRTYSSGQRFTSSPGAGPGGGTMHLNSL